MTVLTLSCVQSSVSLAGSPPAVAVSSLASEESFRADLSGVLASAFEPVAAAVLAKLHGEETAEECERRISAALSEAGCGIVRIALEAGDPAAEQLVPDDRPYYCAGKRRPCTMNRLLSVVRSMTDKSVELSRALQMALFYGDCKRWAVGDCAEAMRMVTRDGGAATSRFGS